MLRTPLEDGEVRLARTDGVVRYPARFQLVMAANPCPCAPPRDTDCTCSSLTKRRYVARLSGPMLDRVDLRVSLRAVEGLSWAGGPTEGLEEVPEDTAAVRARVLAARAAARERWRDAGWPTNAEVPGPELRRRGRLPHDATAVLERQLRSGAMTARGADRALRVAWTISDLRGRGRAGEVRRRRGDRLQGLRERPRRRAGRVGRRMSTTTATDAAVVSPVPPEVLRARAYLSRVAEPPAPALGALVEEIGPVDTAQLVREGTVHGPHALPPAVAAETAARRGTDRAAADLALLAARGGRLIVPEDPEWPGAALAGLGVAAGPDGTVGLEGAPVRDGLAVPLALWACGPRRLDDAPRRWVGMVGARAASEYGLWVARDWSAELADRGVTVVSGAALGVDGAAHRGALAVGGRTVAVLACGIDRSYPPTHATLIDHIARTGLVLTEYPPGATPARHRFLVRNRLVAALSAGTLVVEAAARSGAMRTALVAEALGRAVMVVPGPVTSALSLGCHELARRPAVSVAGRAAHVLEEVGPVGDALAPPPGTPHRADGRSRRRRPARARGPAAARGPHPGTPRPRQRRGSRGGRRSSVGARRRGGSSSRRTGDGVGDPAEGPVACGSCGGHPDPPPCVAPATTNGRAPGASGSPHAVRSGRRAQRYVRPMVTARISRASSPARMISGAPTTSARVVDGHGVDPGEQAQSDERLQSATNGIRSSMVAHGHRTTRVGA